MNDVDELDPGDIQALFDRGRAWQAKGDHVKALADFDELVRRNPGDPQALGHRATARHYLGDFVGAIADYDRAIGIDAQFAWMFNGRGILLYAEDDFQAAVADYNRAIALDPNFADPYRNRGLARFADGDFEAAIADSTEAIRLNPTDALSFIQRAEARLQVEDFEAAIADYDQAIRLDPRQARAYQGRAVAWNAIDHDDQAEADHERADRLDDEDPNGGATMIMTERKVQIHALIQGHFDPTPVNDLTITEREFPHRVRADLQRAVDRVFAGEITVSFFCGVRKTHAFQGISFSELLLRDRHNPTESVPPLYEEVDIGEEHPIRCLKNGLWLLESDGVKFAVFLEQVADHFARVRA